MLRKALLGLAFGLAASCAVAQTAPSPADVGISKGSPDVFKLKGSDNVWTPFGSVNAATHVFIPGTNGNIAPNDCLKWGPGITSAGAACGSGGGGGGGQQLTIYTSHDGLVNNVTTPTEAWTVMQQGFYAPGDGGEAIYQWNFTSECPLNDNTGLPYPADGIYCVLPVGQSPSTPGRYLLQLSNGIDVRQIGMVGDGVFDNSTLNATLMNLINPAASQGSQSDVLFPAKLGQRYADYYFSKSFHITRGVNIKCQGIPGGGGDASTRLVFPAGVHGLVWDNGNTYPPEIPGGLSSGGMSGCGIRSKAFHESFAVTTGSNPVIGVPADKYFNTWDFHVGDGIVMYLYSSSISPAPAVPPGTTVAAVDSVAHTITPSTPLVSPYTGNGWSVIRLPVEDAFTVNTTLGSGDITVTGGPSLLQSGDYIWSDAFPLGTPILNVSGTLGAQSVTTGPYNLDYNNPTPATKTETGGKMWILPAAMKTYVQTSLVNNDFGSFPWGLEMECSFWGSSRSGCNGSYAQGNFFVQGMIGRLVLGDNSGASASIMNVYGGNSIADIAEFGAVGSNYFAENANSQEDNTAIYGIIGACVNSNSSAFYGGYAPTSGGYCATGFATPTTPGGSVVFWNPITASPTGAPVEYNSNFTGLWYWVGFDSAGTQLCMNEPNAPITFSRGNQSCGGPDTWSLVYDGANRGFWNWQYFGGSGGNPLWMTEGTNGGYTGYTDGGHAFMNFFNGFLLYDAETGGSAPGPERLVDEGPSTPTGTFHQLGDIHFNNNTEAGYPFAWSNAYFATTSPVTLSASVTQGATTPVAVSGCPSPTPPAGTVIVDFSTSPIPTLIGTFSSCSGSNLTLQAAAANNAPSGHSLLFQIWEAVGIIQDTLTPTISSCGGGTPSFAAGSNNIGGQFTTGTGSPTSCTGTFNTPYPNHAFCTFTPASSNAAAITGGFYLSAMTKALFTLTLAAGTSSASFDYNCVGN